MLGNWESIDKTENKVFVPCGQQPEKDMTTIVEIHQWAKDTKLIVGEYDLIRTMPGKLVVSTQMTFDFIPGD
jgi:hypothetical protein